MKQNKENKKLIKQLLKDKEFKKIVEEDIGKVSKIEVDWEIGEIRFYGEKQTASVDLNITIALLKNQMH